jgi:hypothetical protein
VYDNTKIIVLTDANRTHNNILPVNTGLHQGCGLPPVFFDIYMNKAAVLFADYHILLAETENDLQRNLYHLNEILNLQHENVN